METIKLNTIKDYQVAYLPDGITTEHLLGMKKAGLVGDDVFISESSWNIATIDQSVPQFFWLAKYGRETYVANYKWLKAWTEYLGGRLPTTEELKEIWSRIPWEDVNEKCGNAWIPFNGYFNADIRRFFDIGEWTYLMSSSENGDGFGSLSLFRGERDAVEYWDIPRHGFSSLVVFG